ncbi:hypothetical protein FRC11_003887 [Ceratobasidium sp. 423]|nr:hypothetical protein FRC11_003887 [Ceratobasidium sp. 423]
MPTPDAVEGTEEQPLVLPSELCSAKVFDALCQFVYPESVGLFPGIKAKDLEVWERVLKATTVLQMDDTAQYIIRRLGEDFEYPHLIRSDAAKALRLITDYDTRPLSQIPHLVIPLCVFSFRRQPISPKENLILGEKLSALVYHTREAVRDCFLWNQASLRNTIHVNAACSVKDDCRSAIFQQIIGNMLNKITDTLDVDNDQSDIFQITSELGICALCGPHRMGLVQPLRSNLVNGVMKKTYLDKVSKWNEAKKLESDSEPGHEQDPLLITI